MKTVKTKTWFKTTAMIAVMSSIQGCAQLDQAKSSLTETARNVMDHKQVITPYQDRVFIQDISRYNEAGGAGINTTWHSIWRDSKYNSDSARAMQYDLSGIGAKVNYITIEGGKRPLSGLMIVIPDNQLFDSSSPDIYNQNVMDVVSGYLRDIPGFILLAGDTSVHGSDQKKGINKPLSRQRITSFGDALVRRSVDPGRIFHLKTSNDQVDSITIYVQEGVVGSLPD